MTIPNYRDQIKVVFFDIDDTLFMKQRDFLPATVPVFMRKLKENGIIPAIATGRTRCAFPHKLNQVIEQEGIDLFVTMNGQMASYRGQVIEKHVIPTEKIRRLVHFFEQHNMPYAFVSDHTVAVSERNSVVQFAMDPILKDYIVDKTFFETKLIPKSNLSLFFNRLAINIPIIIPKTGPPIRGKNFPNFQAGKARSKQKISP